MKLCFECGQSATEDHHVIPESRGGTKTVPLCGKCHDLVHGWGNERRDDHITLTKEGLQRAKEKGTALGNRTNLKEAQTAGRDKVIQKSKDFALSLKPILIEKLAEGMNMQAVADWFNTNNILSARGTLWHCTTISRLMDKCKISKNESVSYYKSLLDSTSQLV